MGRELSRGKPHRKRWLSESHAGALSVHVVARFLRYGHYLRLPLPLMWNVASLEKISLSTKQSYLIFNCVSSQNSRLFTLSAGVGSCTNHILYSLKQSLTQHLPHRHFWHAKFLACPSHWLAETSLKHLTHSFNVVIRHMRSTRTPAFTQAPNFHKFSVPLGYNILVWCVFFKPCTKLKLRCFHRSRHLETLFSQI
jgi:hypothetical protein